MCEELERVVGGRNWLDMMIVYLRKYADEHRDFALHVSRLVEDMNEVCLDRRAFVWELWRVSCKTVPAKTALFLEHMMDKEGNREWKLRDLTKEAREIAFEIESFLLKLMDGNLLTGCICGYVKRNTMEWLPVCEKLERAVGERNWLDMMIVYFDDYASEQRNFARRLNRLVSEMNEACEGRVAFV
ncbi:hypothetical protein Tco_1168013 [Tanacetum coccineum]